MKKALAVCIGALAGLGAFGMCKVSIPQSGINAVTVSGISVSWYNWNGLIYSSVSDVSGSENMTSGGELNFLADYSAVTLNVTPKNSAMTGWAYYKIKDSEGQLIAGRSGSCKSGETVKLERNEELYVYRVLATSGAAGGTSWAVALSYEAVPEHVTMTLLGLSAFGGGTQIVHTVTGPAVAGTCPLFADGSAGWTIRMTADQGWSVPSFSACPMRSGEAVKAEGEAFEGVGTVQYAYNPLGCAVRVYDIATTNMPVYSVLRFDDGKSPFGTYRPIRTEVGKPYGNELPVPSCEGQVFKGWYDADGVRVIASSMARVEGERLLTARWEPATVWVAFDGGVGATGAMKPVKLEYESTLTLSNAFTREGYVFKGWLLGGSTSPMGNYAFRGATFAKEATDGLTVLKAKWEPLVPVNPVHTVSFFKNGWSFGPAEPLDSFTVTSGGTWREIPVPVNAAEPDRPFIGWARRAGGVLVPFDVTGTVAADLPAAFELVPLWGETPIAAALGCTGVFGFETNIVDEASSALTDLVGGWEIAATNGVDGGACMRATLGENSVGWNFVNLTAQVKGPGHLSFKWRIRSPRIQDEAFPSGSKWGDTREHLEFTTNGVERLAGVICGNQTAGDDGTCAWLAVTDDPTSLDADLTAGDMGWQQVELDVAADPEAVTSLKWCFRNSNDGKVGGTGYACVDEVVWNGVAVTNFVSFIANGGDGAMESQVALDGRIAALAPSAFTRAGKAFAGWSAEPDGDVVLADGAADVRIFADTILFAKWVDRVCTVRFEPNGGTGTMPDQTLNIAVESYLLPNVFRKAGFDFAGWAMSAEGGVAFDDIALQSALQDGSADAWTLYAVWTPHQYVKGEEMPVTIHVNGVEIVTSVIVGQTWDGAMPLQPEPPEGMEFEGWYTGPNGTGERVTADTVVEAGVTALYAHFVPGKPKAVFAVGKLYSQVEPALVTEASVYDGRLLDATGTRLMGVVQVKLAKYNAAKDLAKVTATVTVLGGKKLSYKGGEWRKASTQTSLTCAKDSRTLTVCLGERGLTGTFGDFVVDGARNIFTAKDTRSEGDALLAKLKGAYALAYPVAGGWTALSVSVGSKGKAKVTGTVADGTKVSYSGQLLVGEAGCCVPVAFAKKTSEAAVELWLSLEGDQVVAAAVADAVAGKVSAALADKLRFALDTAALAALLPGTVATAQLPNGVPVALNGLKLVVADGAKAGSEGNPSRLKLSLVAKTGLLKGSFKVVSDVGGRSKTTSVTVSGVLVGGIGYGSAQVKKAGSAAVQVAP